MMCRQLEAEMREPIRDLMHNRLGLDTVVEEYGAGYGIADLVGAAMCEEGLRLRAELGLQQALDMNSVKVLLSLRRAGRTSYSYILRRVDFSESTLAKKVLPGLASRGIIDHYPDRYVRLLVHVPKPARRIVAIEMKQSRWLDAILQARRYSFFAHESYIALWNGVADRVDRSLLYRHRLGLIAVDADGAEILVEAPVRKPRRDQMSWSCAEFLLSRTLSTESQYAPPSPGSATPAPGSPDFKSVEWRMIRKHNPPNH